MPSSLFVSLFKINSCAAHFIMNQTEQTTLNETKGCITNQNENKSEHRIPTFSLFVSIVQPQHRNIQKYLRNHFNFDRNEKSTLRNYQNPTICKRRSRVSRDIESRARALLQMESVKTLIAYREFNVSVQPQRTDLELPYRRHWHVTVLRLTLFTKMCNVSDISYRREFWCVYYLCWSAWIWTLTSTETNRWNSITWNKMCIYRLKNSELDVMKIENTKTYSNFMKHF